MAAPSYNVSPMRDLGDKLIVCAPQEAQFWSISRQKTGGISETVFNAISPDDVAQELWKRCMTENALAAYRASDNFVREVAVYDLCDQITTIIHDEIPGYDNPEDFQESDFDNHPLTPFREALYLLRDEQDLANERERSHQEHPKETPATSGPKYEILPDKRDDSLQQPVYRIRALRDIPRHHVREGDMGGYVQSAHNLSQEGDAWIADSAKAIKNAVVSGNALARGNAIITDHAVLKGAALADQFAYIHDNATVLEGARVTGTSGIGGSTVIGGTVSVDGSTNIIDSREYRSQKDVPWSFSAATGSEFDYLKRCTVAATQDPHIRSILEANGYRSETSQRVFLRSSLEDSEKSRASVVGLMKEAGGRFINGVYEPLGFPEMANRRAGPLRDALLVSPASHARALTHVSSQREGLNPATGNPIYAGVVTAQVGEKTYYQPAIVEDSLPSSQSLRPVHAAIRTVPVAYVSAYDALVRADQELSVAMSPSHHEGATTPQDDPWNMRIIQPETPLDSLPMIVAVDNDFDARVTSLTATTDRGFVSFRIPPVQIESKQSYNLAKFLDNHHYKGPLYKTVESAISNAFDLYASPRDLINRLNAEITKNASRKEYLERSIADYGDTPQADRWRDELSDLAPGGVRVLHKISDTVMYAEDGRAFIPAVTTRKVADLGGVTPANVRDIYEPFVLTLEKDGSSTGTGYMNQGKDMTLAQAVEAAISHTWNEKERHDAPQQKPGEAPAPSPSSSP